MKRSSKYIVKPETAGLKWQSIQIALKLCTLIFCFLAFLLLSSRITAQNNDLYFSHGSDTSVRHGDTVSIPLIAEGVENINSMQFTIHFNPNVLEFLSISDLDTSSGFSYNDFGTSEAYEGRIYMVFVDPLGSGASLNDGDTLMNVNMRLIGTPGSKSMFGLQSYPVELQAFGGGSFKDFKKSRIDIDCLPPAGLGRYYSICNQDNVTNRSVVTLDIFGDDFPVSLIFRDTAGQDSLAIQTIHQDSTLKIYNLDEGAYISELFSEDSTLLYRDSVFIYEKDSLTATFTTDDGTCPHIPDGDIFLQDIQNGQGPYTVLWPNGTLHYRSYTDIFPGEYEVKIIDADRCENNFLIEVDGPKAIVDEELRPASCPGASDGRLIVNVLNLDRFPDSTLLFSLDSIAFFYDYSLKSFSLSPGPFTYYIKDPMGCIYKKETFILTENEVFLQNSVKTDPSCFNSGDGEVSVIAALRNPVPGDFNFTWSDSSGTLITNDSAFTATGLSGGTYELTITHSGLGDACIFTRTYQLDQPDTLSVRLDSIQNESCYSVENGFISIEASGGEVPYRYAWSNGDSVKNISNLSAGEYILTVTDDNQCEVIDTFQIDTGLLIQFSSLILMDAKCPNERSGSIQAVIQTDHATQNSVLSYALQPITEGQIPLNSDSLLIHDLRAGQYTLSISDTSGCTLDTTIQIGQPDSIKTTIIDTLLAGCELSNGALTLETTGGTGTNYQYTWSSGSDSSSAVNLSAGAYTVTIEDEAGCVQVDTVVLPQSTPPQLTYSTIVDVECNGDNDGFIALEISPGSFPIDEIRWDSGDSSLIREGLKAGIYSITVSDENNCKLIRDFVINQPDSIEISFQVKPDSTGNSSGSAVAIVEGGVPPYEFVWNTSPIQTDSIADGVPAGTYQVLVRDDNDCTASANVTVPGMTFTQDAAIHNLKLYPNPNIGSFFIQLEPEHTSPMPVRVIIRSLDGKVLNALPWENHNSYLNIHLESSGLFLVEVLYENGKQIQLPVLVQQ